MGGEGVRVADMVIRIAIDTTEPLAGTAAAESCVPVPFVGWLELLRAISELVEPAKAAGERDQQTSGAEPSNDGDDWVWLSHGDVSSS